MERTARLVVLLQPEELKQMKIYAAANGLSMGEMTRIALEEHYGDALREVKRFPVRKSSTKGRKSSQ